MANSIMVDDRARQAVDALKGKLGSDADAMMLLTTLCASWNQIALLYEESEQRHGANVAGTASFLSALGGAMILLRDRIAVGNSQLAALHTQIVNKLSAAAGDTVKIKTVMTDVLNEYSSFQGSVQELKKGLGSLVQASLTALNPGIAAMAGPMVGNIFGTAT
jgi:hypothetical protein